MEWFNRRIDLEINSKSSMYGRFIYIWLICTRKYTIHGWYEICFPFHNIKTNRHMGSHIRTVILCFEKKRCKWYKHDYQDKLIYLTDLTTLNYQHYVAESKIKIQKIPDSRCLGPPWGETNMSEMLEYKRSQLVGQDTDSLNMWKRSLYERIPIWMFPKIVGFPPNHPF